MDDCEIPKFNSAPAEIARLLSASKTVAVVGLSPNPDRPSHAIARYLDSQGYAVIPVNPGHSEILGKRCFKSLLEIPGPVDIVNVFRPPEAVPAIAEEAIQKGAKALWLQTGIVHNAAAEKARAAGLQVVMNKCIKVEHGIWKTNRK